MLAALAGFNISEKGGTVGLAARCGTDCTSAVAGQMVPTCLVMKRPLQNLVIGKALL